MVRQTKTGMSSTTRDRNALFRTTLGWVTETGRKLNLDTQVNTGFNSLFHKFIFHAQEFYRDKRLAVAIQGAAGGVAKPSVATLITISNTIDVLKKRFEAFQYGRNYYNALSSILWTIGGLTVIRELRTTIGRSDKVCGQIGASTSASSSGYRIGPPHDSAYAVDPVAVATTKPSPPCVFT
jgi:hypothetical protein